MKHIHYLDQEPEKTETGAVIRHVITEKDGAPNFNLRVLTIEPDRQSANHSHPWEHEFFVLKGKGTGEVNGETVDLKPGDALYVPPDIDLLDEKQWRYVQRRFHLSPRELEVAKLVCQGFINGDIAKKLNIKPGTVKTHLRSIFAKTHSKNRITMLSRFMEDANNIFSQSPNIPRVPIVDDGRQTKGATVSEEEISKKHL